MSEGQIFVCWGASGHARVLQDILNVQRSEIVAFIDRLCDTDIFLEKPVFETPELFSSWMAQRFTGKALSGIVAIGRQGPDRLSALAALSALDIKVPFVVARQSMVSSSATLGEGSQVLPFGVVAAGAVLGRACIVNHGATVDHECILGDGVHLAPRATLCGCVTVGSDVFVGAGAVVLPRICIGDGAMVGAGAVVTKNVPPGVTVVGSPARVKVRI